MLWFRQWTVVSRATPGSVYTYGAMNMESRLASEYSPLETFWIVVRRYHASAITDWSPSLWRLYPSVNIIDLPLHRRASLLEQIESP